MTHEDALNEILSHCCGSLSDEEMAQNGGFQEYVVDVCCAGSFVVVTKPLGSDGNGFKYEIKEVRRLEVPLKGDR